MASSSRARRPGGGVDDLPAEFGSVGGDDDLLRDSIGRHKQGAQALVAGDHVGQGRAQRVGIEVPAQSQRRRHVVDRRRTLQLLKEPQPVLGERQRNDRRALTCHQRLRPTRTHTDARRQLGHRGRLEHVRTARSVSREALIAAIRRMAVMLSPPRSKKESSAPTRSDAKDLRVDACQDLLDRVGRGAIGTGGVVGCG